MTVRKLIYSLGYRYRLHGKGLPGKPDIVFLGRKKTIFVHGFFWHFHDCKKGKPPNPNLEYWLPKLKTNLERDTRNQELLTEIGWKKLVIWQCQIANSILLKETILEFLEN